jgi:hypothetical protein
VRKPIVVNAMADALDYLWRLVGEPLRTAHD